MALNAKLTTSIVATQTGPNDFISRFTPEIIQSLTLADGTAANQANMLFCDQRTVAGASNDDIDLSGVLTDAFGTAMAMVEIVSVMIINAPASGAANTTNLTIGAATNPFIGFLGGTTPTVGPIGPGGAFMIMCPSTSGVGTVVTATGDILRVANSAGASATYQIAIVARSA